VAGIGSATLGRERGGSKTGLYLPSTAIDRWSLERPAGVRPNLAHLDEPVDVERSRKLDDEKTRQNVEARQERGHETLNVRWWLCSSVRSVLLRSGKTAPRFASWLLGSSCGVISRSVVATWRYVSLGLEVVIFVMSSMKKSSTFVLECWG